MALALSLGALTPGVSVAGTGVAGFSAVSGGTAASEAHTQASASESTGVNQPRPVESSYRPDQRQVAPAPEPRTFSIRAWASRPAHGQPQAWALSESFEAWFPEGLVLGDVDCADGDEHAALLLESSADVISVLSAYSRSASNTLVVDRTGARGVVPGALIKEVLTAKLNLAYDAALGKAGLANFRMGANAPRVLVGMTVEQVVALADRAVAGEFGHAEGSDAFTRKLIDADGDGTGDLTLAEVADGLQGINLGFSHSHQEEPTVLAPSEKAPGRAARASGKRAPARPVVGVSPDCLTHGADRKRCGVDCYRREISRLRVELEATQATLNLSLVEADQARQENRRLRFALEKEQLAKERAVTAFLAGRSVKSTEGIVLPAPIVGPLMPLVVSTPDSIPSDL